MHNIDKERERRSERFVRWSVRVRHMVLILAGLEQAAAFLAQIAFLGATVVLLGGFVSQLKPYDFKVISGLLLSEGVRVFLASKNVEYIVATRIHKNILWGGICSWVLSWAYSLTIALSSATSRFDEWKEFKKGSLHIIFNGLQVASAAVTFSFSIYRLESGDYQPSDSSDKNGVANIVFGITLFYILTLVESSFFLAVKLLGWDALMFWLIYAFRKIKTEEFHILGIHFTSEVYEAFMKEGFSKASAKNLFTNVINGTLEPEEYDGCYRGILEILSWNVPLKEVDTTENINCLIQLTAPGQHESTRRSAQRILASLASKGTPQILLAMREFGRVPVEVMDVEAIIFLDYIVTKAPFGFLPPEAVSKQASDFLIKCIIEGDSKMINAQASSTLLKWWNDPGVYRRYVFDPADIFYRLYIYRQQWVLTVWKGKDYSDLEAVFEYEAIADPIRVLFSKQLECPRSDIMGKFLSRVDFSKLKNKQSSVDLSGIVPEVVGATSEIHDSIVGLVAAWIWFMDDSTFQKVISNLTKEELRIIKESTPIYESILRSGKKEWFKNKEHDIN